MLTAVIIHVLISNIYSVSLDSDFLLYSVFDSHGLFSWLLQIPLAYLTSFDFMRGQPGNVVVWASIVLGQPLAILMYMHEYYLLHMPANTTTAS